MPFSLTPPSIFPPTNKVQHKGSVSETGSCFPQVTVEQLGKLWKLMEKVQKQSDALICVSSYHREARLLAVALLLTTYAEQWRQQQNYKEAVTALILLNKHF